MVSVSDLTVEQALADKGKLRHGALSLPETIGQSIANIAPTLTPAINISVVAGLAGVGSWISYLIATIGCVFVGGCVATLAKRHPEAGSYFVYIGRNFGPVAGAMAGWFMVLAYLVCGMAVASSFPIFLSALLAPFSITLSIPALTGATVVFIGLVAYASFRDIKLSSRVGLLLETVSVGIIVIITAIVLGKHGTIIDMNQLDVTKIPFVGVTQAMAFAVFSFVGFESSATLAKETSNPTRDVPYAVMGSAAFAGLFFTIMTFCMVLGMNDNTTAIGGSGSPFADMTAAAKLPWAASVVYFAATISVFACCLACMNAGSRMLYSMGKYQFLHGSMGMVHAKHKTPYMAVIASAVIILVGFLALVPQTFLNEFNETGTLCTYGFVVVYIGVAVTSAVEMKKAGLLKPIHIIASVIGAGLMGFVVYSSVVPWPAAPDNYLPEIFVAYALIGLVWFLVLRARSPQVLASLANDMEG